MTVTNTSSKQPPQLMNGSATNFSFTFEALPDEPTGIKVTILDTTTDIETELIYNDGGIDGYTATVDADGDGGSVDINDARTSDFTLTIWREYPELQETNYADFNAFPSETVEDNQDLLTFIAQQQSEVTDRSIVLPITTTGVSTELPAPASDEFIGWNTAADALENKPDPTVDAQAAADAAAVSAAAAAASAAAALTSEGNAATSESNSSTSETNAAQSETCAQAWAENPEDSAITAPCGDGVTDFSALHYAAKAASSAASNALPTVSFPANEGQILVARAAASPDSYALEANITTLIDDFTIINPTGDIEVAPFMLDNIVLNAMRIAENNALTIQQLSDGIEDTYTDQTGIDLGASANEDFEVGSYRTEVGALAENTKLILNADGFYTGMFEIEDSSGNDHIVTQVGDATLSPLQKQFGDGAYFNDGSSRYLTAPDSADWDIIGSLVDSWTIDLWVKHINLAAQNDERYLHQESGGSSNDLWFFNKTGGGTIRFFSNREPGTNNFNRILQGNGGMATDDWHHIAVTKVAADWGMYIDGFQIGQATQTGVVTVSDLLYIGSSDDPGNFMNGYMDELRIIKADPFSAVPIDIPFFHFRLDDNLATTNVTDNGSGSNTGTLEGGDDTEDLHASGKVRNAFDFNGTDDRVNINGVVASIAADTTGTFMCWINKAVTDSGNICSISDASSFSFLRFALTSVGGGDNLRCELVDGSGTVQFTADTSNNLITPGFWHQVAFVQDGTSVKIYIDGVSQSVTNLTSTDLTQWLTDLTLNTGRIGCISIEGGGNTVFFDGRIDDVRYYSNVALTITQVQSVRTAGLAGVYGIGGANITVPTVAHVDTVDTHLLLHFDSATIGNDLVDSSTGGVDSPHTITPVNGVGVTGKFGNACYLGNGTDAYLTVPVSTDWDDIFNSLVTSHTIDLWINPITTDDYIASQQVDSSNRWAWSIPADGRITFFMKVANVNDVDLIATAGTVVIDGEWHHLAAIKVNADWGLYYDGVRVASDVQTLTPSYGVELLIGTDGNSSGGSPPYGSWWNGFMDDFRIQADNAIFSADPTTANPITVPTVAAVATGATSLLLGFNTQDEGPFNNIPTFFGSTAIDNANAKFGSGAYDFNGTTDYITFPNSDNWNVVKDPKEDWTIDLWVKHTDHAGDEVYIEQFETALDLWQLRHSDGNGLRFLARNTAGDTIDTGQAGEITDPNYHHVAVIKLGSESAAGAKYGCYLDGSQVNYTESALFFTFDALLYIGQSGVPSQLFDGQMDGIRISQTNVIFNGAPNIAVNNMITVPIASPSPISTSSPDLLLQSISNPVIGAAPDTIQAYFDLADIDPTVLLNTDITLEVSRDGGTTFTAGTLAVSGQQATAGRRLISAEVDVSGQPDPGVDAAECIYKLESANEVQWRVHAGSLIWG